MRTRFLQIFITTVPTYTYTIARNDTQRHATTYKATLWHSITNKDTQKQTKT